MLRLNRFAIGAIASITLFAARSSNAQDDSKYINPPGLAKPAGYTHVVLAADGRTIYIAGQIAVDSTNAIVGPGDFRAQGERVFANLRIALASVGATFSDVVKTTTFITDVSNSAALREIRAKYLDPARPPANSLIPVPALARPELLLEIEAVAVLKTPRR